VQSSPILQHLVLVGGGHAHVEVLRRFAMRPVSGLRITLVSDSSGSAYSGMLPGRIAGHYAAEEIHIDLRRLANVAGARFILAKVCGLDPQDRVLSFDDRPALAYDLVSLNIGSVPALDAVPGAEANALSVKPVEQFLRRWAELTIAAGPLHIGVVGGGAAGVEIILALQHRLGAQSRHQLSLFEAGLEILPRFSCGARQHIQQILAEKEIAVQTECAVQAVDGEGLDLQGGVRVSLDAVIWATGASAPRWLGDTGLAVNLAGFVLVDHYLQSLSHASVFVAGDIAVIENAPVPRAGVYAVRQGVVLADNLRRALLGQSKRRYRPQQHFLNLLSAGSRHGVASRGRLFAAGAWVWRWKNWIDRRFIERYAQLVPAMLATVPTDTVPELSAGGAEALMRCKGCGAKLGPVALSRALERLVRLGSAVALSNLDDAAVLIPPPGQLLLQSVDFFPALVGDPYLFGQIAANHCLGDLYAMGAKPWTALAVAQVPSGSPDLMQDDLFQMLAGAASIFEAEGVVLIGGHSGQGDDLALGFTVNGLASPEQLSRKSGLRSGDVLIVTKPVGTGVLFAAEMRGLAKAVWIDRALQAMRRGCGQAAAVLVAHGATAMTDVTGFGLAGHLGEMLSASTVDSALDPAAIPALDGAIEMLEVGVESSLSPDNQERVMALLADPSAWSPSIVGLLGDPQTAGGLLAGVPAERAAACLQALRATGDDARAIGTVTARRYTAPAIHRI
jgi:selenide,water dikinase